MIQISSFQFENSFGETLQVEVDLSSTAFSIKSKDGFTVESLDDFEQITARLTQTLKEIKEASRKK